MISYRVSAVTLAFVLAVGAFAEQSKRETATKSKLGSGEAPQKTPELPPFDKAKLTAGMVKMTWSLGIQHQHEEYKPKTARDVASDFGDGTILGKRPLLIPYKEQLPRIATLLGVLGDSITYFFYGAESTSFPFEVVDYKGTKCFVAYVATADVYNTLKLSTTKQRAAKIAASHAIPALREMANVLLNTDIKTIAVFVIYGTKNFLDDSALATQAEAVAIVASVKNAKDFNDGDITDTEFMKSAIVFVSDRTETFDFTRVELQLE